MDVVWGSCWHCFFKNKQIFSFHFVFDLVSWYAGHLYVFWNFLQLCFSFDVVLTLFFLFRVPQFMFFLELTHVSFEKYLCMVIFRRFMIGFWCLSSYRLYFRMVLLLKVTMSFTSVRESFRTWSTVCQLILGCYFRLGIPVQGFTFELVLHLGSNLKNRYAVRIL